MPCNEGVIDRGLRVVAGLAILSLAFVGPQTPWAWFGLVPLPDLLDKNKELGDTLALVHKTLNLTMAALVISHVAAAVKHHVFDRDDVLARMLPFLDNNKVTR